MVIYCAQCGKESPQDARFCSACGRPLVPGTAYARAPLGSLVRARAGRKVSGVCQGLANLYGWDVSIVRIVFMLLAIVTFPIGFVVYALAMMIAPEEPLSLPASTSVNQG